MTTAESDAETTARRALRWDGTVTAGNVLTAAAMTLALVVWGLRLESRVTTTEERTARLEAGQIRDDAEKLLLREGLATLRADMAALLRAQARIEVILDRHFTPSMSTVPR